MKRTPLKRKTPLRRSKPLGRTRTPEATKAWEWLRGRTAYRASGRCEAHGMHAKSCPGECWLVGHAHHVHPRAWGGTDSGSRLLWVHPDCHARIHSHPAEATERGYLTRGETEGNDDE